MSPTPPTDPRRQKARQIAVEILAELSDGGDLDEQSWLEANPQCADELREELRRIRVIKRARADDDARRTREAAAAASPASDPEDPDDESELTDADVRMTILESKHAVRATLCVGEDDDVVGTSAELEWPDVDIVDQPTRHFRPTIRPPMAVIRVWDDNQSTGRLVRVLDNRFTIGRSQADLVVPHDVQVSGQHAEIVRSSTNDGWQLRDLNSTNGTFVKVSNVRLRDGMELFIGGQRFRFDANRRVPKLTVLAAVGDQESIEISDNELWVGRVATAPDCLQRDLMLGEKDAFIFQPSPDSWQLREGRSLNGVWAKIKEVPLISGCQFQVGEQRIGFYVP
jgi:hypothetical protein